MNKLKVNITIFIILIIGLFNILRSQESEMMKYHPETGFWFCGTAELSSDNSLFVWQNVSTPLGTQITDIYFIDSLNGWLTHTSNGAMKSTNSGFNWSLISFNDTNFTTLYNSVYFINQNTGWCVGGAIQIRKSTDGGLTWFKQYGPPVAGIARSVYFFDANTGVICGSKSFPYLPFTARTTNGGTNWTEQSPSIPGAQELNEQYWFNSNTGWLCGYDVLLYTTNGGANYTNRYSNIPPTGNGHSSLLAITFFDQQTGWLGAANLERYNVYKTTNGGLNWVFQNNPVSQGGINQVNDIKFINADYGWAVHGTPTTGAIMFTSNGGINWGIEEQSANWFDCLSIYQNKKVWCGASSGLVWYTLPGGLIGIKQLQTGIPAEYNLYQNYPNPFNPVTRIKFSLPNNKGESSQRILLNIYDMLGRKVSAIVNDYFQPGSYEAEWNGSNFSSGVYFYKLESENYTAVKKLTLMK